MTRLLLTISVLFLVLPSDPFGPLNQVPAVNHGGCGWVAYYIARNLPGLTIEVLGDYDHIFVRWKGRLIDSRGVWGPLAILLPTTTISLSELRENLNEPGRWNQAFRLSDTAIIQSLTAERHK